MYVSWKTFLGGQLLAAVGRDDNDQMYPVAWTVVEAENIDSWVWFFIKHNCNSNYHNEFVTNTNS